MVYFKRKKTRNIGKMMDKRDKISPPRTPDLVTKSIIDTRKVYSGMLDSEFANWYSRRYGIDHNFVWSVLEKEKESQQLS